MFLQLPKVLRRRGVRWGINVRLAGLSTYFIGRGGKEPRGTKRRKLP